MKLHRIRIALYISHFACTLALACEPAGAQVAYAPEFFPGALDSQLAPRTALVVGVPGPGDQGFSKLSNPANDAREITRTLRSLGFSVIAPNESYRPAEITRQVIKLAIYDFATTLRRVGGVGLVYFSGHGLETDGELYLAASDVYIRFDRDLHEELLPITLFFDAFAYAGNRLNLLVVDSCRDFPLGAELERFGATAKSKAIREQDGVVIGQATLSGKTASDGSGALSPYAKAFLKALSKQDIGLAEFFITEIGGGLAGFPTPVVIVPGSRDFVFYPTKQTYEKQRQIYASALKGGNRALFTDLTTRYSGGYFAKLAQDCLDNCNLARERSADLVQAVAEAPLRSAPSAAAPIVGLRAEGETLRLASSASFIGSNHWAAVVTATNPTPVYASLDSLKPVPLVRTAYSISLDLGISGQPEISAASRTTITQIAASLAVDQVSQVEVVGLFDEKAKDSVTVRTDNLLRQAVVLSALKDAGLDTTQVAIVSRPIGPGQTPGQIQVVLNAAPKAKAPK